MFSTLRTRFGIPGVISVIALVFAMIGGAWAANNSSGGGDKATASAKAKKGPRGPKGATGPAGPAGPQGPAGANGKDGANGSNGSNGKDGADGAAGKSIEVSGVAPGCDEGGATVEVENEPATAQEVCNGKDGQTGFTETLPSGKTETGVYGVPSASAFASLIGPSTLEEGEEGGPVATSFPIPLASSPAFVFVPGVASGYGSNPGAGCPGVSGVKAQANSGKFCVYGFANDNGLGLIPSAAIEVVDLTQLSGEPVVGTSGVTPGGALLKANCSDGGALNVCFARGLWAVTG